MNYFWELLAAGAGAINLSMGIFVFSKNPRGGMHQAFFIFAFGISLWSAGIAFMYASRIFFFDRIIFAGAAIMLAGLVLLSKTFPDRERITPGLLALLLPILGILAAVPFNFFTIGIRLNQWGIPEPENGPYLYIFVMVFSAYILYSFYSFIRSYLRASGLHKAQIQYLFLGAIIFSVISFPSSAILPAFHVFSFNLVGPISSLIFVGFTGYAIVKHQLLSIKIIIQRGLIYTALLAIITSFYLLLIFVLQELFYRAANISALISGAITAIAGIYGAPAIERWFRKITDKIFFKDKYEYSKALEDLSEILNRNLDHESIVRKTEEKLAELLRADKVSYMFPEPENHIRQHDDDLARFVRSLPIAPQPIMHSGMDSSGKSKASRAAIEIAKEIGARYGLEITMPIIVENKIAGAIGLGAKLSGDPYSDEDIHLLRTFAYQAGVALEKAKLYEKVRKYSLELEAKVRERTAQLKELQEEQRRIMIDISHDLQTPLTVMKGELQFLKKNSPRDKKLIIFEKSIDEISKFIYDLLHLARLETNREDIKLIPENLSSIVEELVEYFEVPAEDKGIKIISSIEPNITAVCDRKKIEEAVTNLVSNSMKYIGDREKIIRLKLLREGKWATITVEDTGIGIPKEDLPKLFNRFYRAGDSSGEKGSGLGLAIVKKIIEKHGGEISVESTVGMGTKMSLKLRL